MSTRSRTCRNNNNNNNNNTRHTTKEIWTSIRALFSTNENEDENENEIAAMLSMMNRFVALLGKYSFCPSLHRSTPGVTNATEIWKPVDSTTTTCSSRNFEPDGKESFDDDDDDYERDEAVKVNEFFRKTFGNEDVVVTGTSSHPSARCLLLYYFRPTRGIASVRRTGEQRKNVFSAPCVCYRNRVK